MDQTSIKIKNMMTLTNEQFLFDEALCARVQELRDGKGWTQDQMALALGIPAERYKKYENRSAMPQYLIPKFAQIVDRSIEYVMTGKERKQLPLQKPQQSKKRA